jgi:isopropylmalate/homocitrate/citramalate synthase
MLSDSGLPYIEATSFVSPRAIPQLADATDVMETIRRVPGVRYPVLVPNIMGMERAVQAGATDVAVFTAASESFTKANINATIEESLQNFEPVIQMAQAKGISVRGYVSTAFGCPYEGEVPPKQVWQVTRALFAMGVSQVSLGDTIGVGTPNQVADVLGPLLGEYQTDRLAVHFHDTRGTALANVLMALEMGITTIDSSSGGLGGCPYAPGASGNLSTEDLLYMLDGMGIETGVEIGKIAEASIYINGVLGRGPTSKYLQAYLASGTRASTATR